MDYSKKFEPILNENEKIEKTYKPNKTKYWVGKALWYLLYLVFGTLFAFAVGSPETPEEGQPAKPFSYTAFGITMAIVGVLLILGIIYVIFYYRNLYYAVTNQRVIIRSGVFGTDFKALDMKNIGAQNVRVTLLDKIVHKNTGTIAFGSNQYALVHNFIGIVDPYNESKFIKTIVDRCKNIPAESVEQKND